MPRNSFRTGAHADEGVPRPGTTTTVTGPEPWQLIHWRTPIAAITPRFTRVGRTSDEWTFGGKPDVR
jgi:hypothetical protein